ncbi:MAG TPA: methyltransferase domain-containing protein [Candidatus Eremiobacteraceae bacterium]|nr:methyltransferase domain-containing protein [Candidatus Eremiobacteraceae bacterium]
MTEGPPIRKYSLGNTDAEHERLARQSKVFNPLTERLFRAAGIGEGQRVLDLGSGAGDVAMLLAELVGSNGEVVGVERHDGSIARARARCAQAGLHNVSFYRGDVADVAGDRPFDAAVGRWILMYVPDPVAVVRAASNAVRPGGAIAFQEVSWESILSRSAPLPLTGAAVRLLHAAFAATRADTEMGYALRGIFEKAGLPPPSLHMETLLGNEAELAQWLTDTLASAMPQLDEANPLIDAVGEFATLPARMLDEMTRANAVIAWISVIGAWSTKPG